MDKRTFNLPPDKVNYAQCFDCVPEENSLLLSFGGRVLEVPALDLILTQPQKVLGQAIFDEFGAEFRSGSTFDTVEGGNLSLQVHPLRSYISEHFNIPYTQDESYYILTTLMSPKSTWASKMASTPRRWQQHYKRRKRRSFFAAEQFVNIWPSHSTITFQSRAEPFIVRVAIMWS
jgi:mannose-6-phosphate isomerase